MPIRDTKLQSLWDLAQATLSQSQPPSPEQLDALKQALALVPLNELGCSAHSNTPSQTQPEKPPEITYLHIQENKFISLGIFCLPSSSQIPLHNHPGMTVLSRVLYGNMHIQSFDAQPPHRDESHHHTDSSGSTRSSDMCDTLSIGTSNNSNNNNTRKTTTPETEAATTSSSHTVHKKTITNVLPVHDKVFTPDDPPIVLFPSSGGNIHQFTALTDCAVLDLLSPPYSPDDGRDCTYYKLRKSESGDIELVEFEPPNEFTIHSKAYTGTSVVLKSPIASPLSTNSSDGSGSPQCVTPTHQPEAPLHQKEEEEEQARNIAHLQDVLKVTSLDTPMDSY